VGKRYISPPNLYSTFLEEKITFWKGRGEEYDFWENIYPWVEGKNTEWKKDIT